MTRGGVTRGGGSRGGASGFDRVRPRGGAPNRPGGDAAGTRALYSVAPAAEEPAFGAVTLACSRCGQRSVLSLRQLVRVAVPSVHLPLLRRHYPSLMRCPACGRMSWLRLRVQL